MLPRTEAGFFASANRPLGYASRLDSTRLSLSPSQAAYNAEQARLLVEFANMVKPAFLFDGRNILDCAKLQAIGFQVWAVGKALNMGTNTVATAKADPAPATSTTATEALSPRRVLAEHARAWNTQMRADRSSATPRALGLAREKPWQGDPPAMRR